MKKEDIEFLKELQSELKMQDSDMQYSCHQANPRFWGIMERKEMPCPEGCGDVCIIDCDDFEQFSLEEFVEHIDTFINEYDEDIQEQWKDIDKEWFQDVFDFAEDKLEMNISEAWYTEEDVLSENTGCFLTKRAAQAYIERQRHNLRKPRTYAMTAHYNPEYERLLKILTEMNFDDIRVDEE